MSKASTPGKFLPASRIVAVLAILGIAGGASLYLRGESHGNRVAAASPQKPEMSVEKGASVRASLQALPLAFEENQGQTDPQVKYMARGSGYTVFLTGNDTVFALHSSAHSAETTRNPRSTAGVQTPGIDDRSAAIHMQLVGGNPQSVIAASHELPSRSNYFIGTDSRQWHSNVAQYARVAYADVYPGVDMAFYGVQKQLEFDFIVAPGASPRAIRLGLSGTQQITTDDSGNLVLGSSAGDVVLHKPFAYQQKDGVRQPVDASFVLLAKNQVKFQLGNYDRNRELVIDPSVSYSTYLGGTGEDDAISIAIDGSGNAYVTGQTKSANFPIVTGAEQSTNGGGFDVFVSKVSADGSSLVYSTYVGGPNDDTGNAIAVDASGNAFVVGGTATGGFPVTTGVLQGTFQGGSTDAFVFELAASGGSLTYSTYLGGTGDDVAFGVAVDSSDNAYVVGSTGSSNFPLHSAIQTALAGTSNGFVTKLNSAGSALVYSTYLGGGSGDYASAVALDSSDNAYVTGATQSPLFPVSTNAFQKTCGTAANCNGSLYDAFVSVINAAGSGFVYSTYLGGGATDQGFAIAVDSAGDAYVTGMTQSSDFPRKGALQTAFGGTQDAFVTALNPGGTALLYSTYLGGTGADAGAGIAVDANKTAYVTGQTRSSNFNVLNATQTTLGGGSDAFVSEINSAGALVFSTYLGGSGDEDAAATASSVPIGAIAVDSTGANIYVTGNTASPTGSFPTTTGSFRATYGGGSFDAFVTKYTQTATSSGSFTVTNGALSATSGGAGVSATSTITVTSVNNFNSTVSLTCSVAPVVAKGPTCGFNNASVTPTSTTPATSTLTVSTTAATALLEHPSDRRSSGMLYAMFLPVGGMVLFGAGLGSGNARRRKLFGLLMLGLVLLGLLVMPACSSSSGGGGGGGSPGTPAGAYTITVTGTSAGLTATGTPALTLTIN